MLNLDFDQTAGGVIPSKSLYPLHVPQGELEIKEHNRQKVLVFREGQGLNIPHSALLEPDGCVWLVSVRVYVSSDGLVLSQGNEASGFAVYIQDGTVQAALANGKSIQILKEREDRGISNFTKKWVSIELRIERDMATLSLNRTRVAVVMLESPFSAKDCTIRLGTHPVLPVALRETTFKPDGFTGAISSLKILRQ